MAHTAFDTVSINKNSDKSYLIKMPNQITTREADYLEQQLMKLKQDELNTQKIIYDFSETTFMDSSGLNGLCKIIKASRQNQIKLDFSNFRPEIKIILSLTGLDNILPFNNSSMAKTEDKYVVQLGY